MTENKIDCECINWARTDQLLFGSHHKSCPGYNIEEEVHRIITDLLDGILFWASDEDGIHPDCWEAFKKACYFIGEPNRVSLPENR